MGIFAVILGILALLCGLLGTMLFGSVGMIISLVLAAVAIVLALLKRKKDGKGGIPGIVICVIAIVTAVASNNTWSKAFTEIRKKALEYKPDSIWAQASEDVSHGLMGIIKNLPQDEASLNALVEEMNELNKYTVTDSNN